ncbi:hypothetical protein [Lysinibacillus pakistanensis]|nr:hypothetical protein [Lysinibacillus pakistanensis]
MREENEVQNDEQNEKSSGKAFAVGIGLMILLFIIDNILKL